MFLFKSKFLTLMFAFTLSLICAPLVVAQSQALNGQIEGTISDQAGAALSNTVITATNIETGAIRTATTDDSGVYRFPLLPLGIYQITAEAANFKKLVRTGVTLTTGQTATVDINLPPGDISEAVTISSDTSVADTGKTDSGRVMNTRETQNLPLVSRNPYNFALLQANVTGRANRGFAFPNVNANGYLRRVNYQIDGNTNTQGNRGSIPLLLISDVFVSEVQLVTNNFAAEFGNTPGLIMNVVTPSGTNRVSGAIGYRFRRPSFYSRPFFFSASDLPDNKADDLTAQIGAPVIHDRWHFYTAYEYVKRDDKATAARLLTISTADKAQLVAAGLSPAIFPAAIPGFENDGFYIFRTDAQLNDKNRLTVRFNHSDTQVKNFINGRFNTLERGSDTTSVDYSLGVQIASFAPRLLNEFRFQYGQRAAGNKRNEFSGSGPSIVINGIANFGSPTDIDTIFPPRKITQIQDNLTRTIGSHVFKVGGGFNFYNHTERSAIFSQYTFLTIDAYIAARNGSARSYANYQETFGDPEIKYKAAFWNFFAQDDWKLTRRLKINCGLRYDLYRIPEADASSPFLASRRFNVDKNNFAPRIGVVYALREGTRQTILRFGAGIYYDQPLLAMYSRALQNNGNPKFFTFQTTPTIDGAPAFPNTLGSLPAGSVLPRQSVDTIAPDFETMYALHSNIQIEQAITENLSFAVGFTHSGGRHIPIYRSINPINPDRLLADGRPVFSPILSAATRLDPRFNVIQTVEPVGVSRYGALTLQLTKRFSRGLQFSANYTISKAVDDAPEQNMTTGAIQGLVLSDPNNRRLDKGNSFADQPHTFVMTLIANPKFNFADKTLRMLLNHNQVGVLVTANSGETFNIISNSDLNGDGVLTSDRPVGIKRNAGRTPPQYNVDLRGSRFLDFTERYKLEVFGEFQNLFNTNSIVGFSDVSVSTDLITGELIGAVPDFKKRNRSTAQDSRQFQIGFRFIF